MGKSSVHDQVMLLLPWFVNESLGEKEQRLVLDHLRSCADCRAERDALQQMQQVIVDDPEPAGADYRFAYKKLMQRIEAKESGRDRAAVHARRSGVRRALPYLGAAASLVLAVSFVALLDRSGVDADKPDAPEYRTLSSQALEAGAPHRMALTFEQPIRAETLRAALIETHSNIVSGPDPEGTYIVEVPVPDGVTDADFIEGIRKIDGVKHAAFAPAADRPR